VVKATREGRVIFFMNREPPECAQEMQGGYEGIFRR
jgi:hypothetical protein